MVLLQLLSDESRLNVNACNPPEFDAWRWVNYWYPLNQVVAFKREVYRRALKELAPLWRLHTLFKGTVMLTALRSIVQEVNAARDLASVLNIIVARVKAVMSTEVCSVYLRDSSGAYVLMATDGLNPDSVGRVRLALNEGLVGLVAAREEPINLEHAENHPKFQYFPETGEERYSAFWACRLSITAR